MCIRDRPDTGITYATVDQKLKKATGTLVWMEEIDTIGMIKRGGRMSENRKIRVFYQFNGYVQGVGFRYRMSQDVYKRQTVFLWWMMRRRLQT